MWNIIVKKSKQYPILVIGVLALLSSITLACGQDMPDPPIPTPLQVKPPPPTEKPASEELPRTGERADSQEWNKIKTFTGQGNTTTPVFHISGTKWCIDWMADTLYPEYAVLDLIIYRESSKGMYTKRISYDGASIGDNTCILMGEGDYYIKVIAENLKKWTITIEDYVTKAVLSPIQITHIHFKGRGLSDSVKEDHQIIEADEYVEIKNQSDTSQRITGWLLKNISKGFPSFRFPTYFPCSCTVDNETCIEDCVPLSPCVLEPHRSIRVYTGEVHYESGGFCFQYLPGDIWNNEKADVAVLYNPRKEEVSRRSYFLPTANKVSAEK